jgi:hypothetical protein
MSRSPRRTPIQASSATMTASRPTQPAGDSLAPLPKDITLDMVRQWLTTAQSERGVRWPILLDECLAPVVTACNDEKRALAVEQAIADEMQAIRRSIQAIRSVTDVLLTELPVVRGVYTNWPK